MERYRQTQMDKDALRKILDTERRNSGDVRGQIGDLQEKLTVKNRENDRLRDEIVALTERLMEVNKVKTAIEEELNTRKDLKKIPMLKTEIVKLRGKVELLEREMDKLTASLKQKNSEIEHLRAIFTDSQSKSDQKDSDLRTLLSQKSALESDIAQLKSQLLDAKSTSDNSSKSSQILEKDIELLKRQLKNLTNTLSARESEVEKLRTNIDSEHEKSQKDVQTMRDEQLKEKNALIAQNSILTQTISDMRKQNEGKAEEILKGIEREKRFKEEIGRLEEELMLRDGEIGALKGEIEGLMRNIEENKAEFAQEREVLEGKIRDFLSQIDNSVQILFKKIRKKLKKHDLDPAELTNSMSESGKLTISPIEFKKSLKSLKILIDKMTLKVVFRLLGDENCDINLEVLKEKLRKKEEKAAEENPEIPLEKEASVEQP